MPESTSPLRSQNPFDALKMGDATLRMLLIGIDGYRHMTCLNFAVADCEGLAGALLESSKDFPSRVSVPIVGDREISSPVTLESIENGFGRLLSGVKSQDTVLIYFSGHGDLDQSTEELYLCLTETQHENLSETALSVKALLQRLKDSGASSQVLILDTCHSGGIVARSRKGADSSEIVDSSRSTESETSPQFTPRLTEILNQHASPSREFCALLSCQATQLSWEFAHLGHGAFTHYLMEGLQSSPKTIDRLGRIDVESLYDYVRDHTHDLVLQWHGKQQTPSRIVSGSNKIFVGARNSNRSLEERRNSYSEAVRNLLRQSYQPDRPITEKVADQLERIADQEAIPPQSKLEIEVNEIRDLEDELNLYWNRLSQWLHQNHPQDPMRFCAESRTSLGFDSRITLSFDSSAKQELLDHKNDYGQRFRQYKYEESESYDAVRSYGISLKFSESSLDYLEEKINEEFLQRKRIYSGQVQQVFRHHLKPTTQQIQLLQEKARFCDRISQEIIDVQRELLEQDKEAYRTDVRKILHAEIEPNLELLKILQENLGLGDAIVKAVREEEQKCLDQHCEQYRQQYSRFIRENEILSPDTLERLKRLATALEFHSPTRTIVESIEQKEEESCKQLLSTYRQVLIEVILREGPLNIKANNQLKSAESLSQLGQTWIQPCQKEEIKKFNRDQGIYYCVYEDRIRETNSLTDDDRVILKSKQAELDLGDLVVKDIESRADSNLSRDKEEYRRSFRDEIRQRLVQSAVKQDLKQRQTDLNLGDAIVQAIEIGENEKLTKDKESYKEAVVNELDRGDDPLSIGSERDLKRKQEDLELCDEVTQKIKDLETKKYNAKKAAKQEYKLLFSSRIRGYNLLAGESLREDHRSELDEHCKIHDLDIKYANETERYLTLEYKKRLEKFQSTYQKELQKESIDREMLDRLREDEEPRIDLRISKSIESDVDRSQPSTHSQWTLPSWQFPSLSMDSVLSPVKITLRRSKQYVVERSHHLKVGALCMLGVSTVAGGTIALIHWKKSQPPEPIAVPMESLQFGSGVVKNFPDRNFFKVLLDRAVVEEERLKKAKKNDEKGKDKSPSSTKQPETNASPPLETDRSPQSLPDSEVQGPPHTLEAPEQEIPSTNLPQREAPRREPESPPAPEPPPVPPPESAPEKPPRPETGDSIKN